jgi:CheY-like chemotaxis protein
MKKEILIIDDSRPIRFLLHTILQKHYKVTSVPDGLSAMFYLKEETNIDLIIVDPDLPDMPNWELVKHLSTSFFFRSIPIIAVSNQPLEITRSQAMKFNIAGFYMKPFNPLEILEAVDNIIFGNVAKKIS